MRLNDIIKISFANIWRTKNRSILTIMSICIGVSSVLLISSLGDSGSKLISAEIDKAGITGVTIYTKDTKAVLDSEYIDAIYKYVPYVSEAQPIIIESGNYHIKNKKGNAVIWGIGSNISGVMTLNLLHGRLPNSSDISQRNKVVVVDSEFAKDMYGRTNIIGKKMKLTVSNHTETFEIIGVIASQKDGLNHLLGGVIPQFIYIPYKTLGAMRGSDSITQIAIKCVDTEKNDKAGEMAVAALARVSGLKDVFDYENINTHISQFKNIASIITLLISAIAAISLFVAGLGIMNTMLAAIGERKEEIGIMMAIGAKRRDIALCFITESFLISTFGGISGTIIGTFLSYFITQTLNMPTVINLNKLIFAVSLAIVCGVTFSFIPAQRASRMDPVEILHK
ncbi:MAG: ABC transporter permease [Clostridia bacterium]|nr:ABC transporter permease [Clostridia bacterium]